MKSTSLPPGGKLGKCVVSLPGQRQSGISCILPLQTFCVPSVIQPPPPQQTEKQKQCRLEFLVVHNFICIFSCMQRYFVGKTLQLKFIHGGNFD